VQAFTQAGYTYSFNNPTNLRDPTGRWPTPWDVADFAFAAHSLYQAYQNPSLSNVGWAAADVAGAALPIIPTTKAARLAWKNSDAAIQSIRTGVRKSKHALDMAQTSRALGRAANKAESVDELRRVATKREDLQSTAGESISLGKGSNASVVARNLAGKGAEIIPLGDGRIGLKTSLEERSIVVLRNTSRSGAPTVEVQSFNMTGEVETLYKFRAQKAGWLFK
jgi:hypothetical protein